MEKKIVLTAEQAHLKDAMEELKDNGTILCKCSEDMQEAIIIAGEQKQLGIYRPNSIEYREGLSGKIVDNNYICYVIHSDTTIEVEEPKRWIEKAGYILCPIKNTTKIGFTVTYPDGDESNQASLGALHHEDFCFIGFHFDNRKNKRIYKSPRIAIRDDGSTVHVDSTNTYLTLHDIREGWDYITATHTVWKAK